MPSKSFLPLPSLGCSMPLSRVPCTKEQGRRRPQHARERPSTYPPPLPCCAQSIIEDPDGFIEQGGWEFLNMDKSDSEDGEGEEQSEDYAPSGSEEEEEEVGPVHVAGFGGPCASCGFRWALCRLLGFACPREGQRARSKALASV